MSLASVAAPDNEDSSQIIVRQDSPSSVITNAVDGHLDTDEYEKKLSVDGSPLDASPNIGVAAESRTERATDTREANRCNTSDSEVGLAEKSERTPDDEEATTLVASTSAQEESVLLQQAISLYEDDQLLEAARILRRIPNRDDCLTDHTAPIHNEILQKAHECEELITMLKSSVDDQNWTKQGESHGTHDTVIYYKLDLETRQNLTARVETPIEQSLLVPLLSVLNETELYDTWIPSWKHPRLRLKRCVKLRQSGRVSQIILLTFALPWPLASREVVVSALGMDDINANGDIAVRLCSLDTGDEGGLIPPPDKEDTVRVDFQGGFLFRRCPLDHPALENRIKRIARRRHHHRRHHHHKHHHGQEQSKLGNEGQEGGDFEKKKHEHRAEDQLVNDDLILVTFAFVADAKMTLLPRSFLNFVLRTAIGMAWNKFLKLAEDVRDGKRPQHSAAIKEKRGTLYDWVEARVQQMLAKFRNATCNEVSSTASSLAYGLNMIGS